MFHQRAVGRARFSSVSDFLHHGAMVKVTCLACDHRQELDPTWLYRLCLRSRISPSVSVVERRLKCLRCGKRQATISRGRYAR